jgi:hypothetical protein
MRSWKTQAGTTGSAVPGSTFVDLDTKWDTFLDVTRKVCWAQQDCKQNQKSLHSVWNSSWAAHLKYKNLCNQDSGLLPSNAPALNGFNWHSTLGCMHRPMRYALAPAGPPHMHFAAPGPPAGPGARAVHGGGA